MTQVVFRNGTWTYGNWGGGGWSLLKLIWPCFGCLISIGLIRDNIKLPAIFH